MRIDRLTLTNFRCFKSEQFRFHPEFSLIVGENAAGKSAILDALRTGLSSVVSSAGLMPARLIGDRDVRLQAFEYPSGMTWEPQLPCDVSIAGTDESGSQWTASARVKNRPSAGGAQVGGSSNVELRLGEARSGTDVVLPLLASFCATRLSDARADALAIDEPPRESSRKRGRDSGYDEALSGMVSVARLADWLAHEAWRSVSRSGDPTPQYRVATTALAAAIPGADSVYFEPELREVAVRFDATVRPLSQLSDGQRSVLALFGDLIRRATLLNPHLDAEDVLAKTPGVVLVDELDLHLHPKWQRHVIEDLRRTFPKVQFICTTHSPFLIQSLRSGAELLSLDSEVPPELENLPLDEIARLQGVQPEASQRYLDKKGFAATYMKRVEKLADAPVEERQSQIGELSELLQPYADDPAFQAFLELHRVAKLGA